MKKKLFISLVSILFYSTLSFGVGPEKRGTTDLKTESMKGKVKTLTEYEYMPDGIDDSIKQSNLISKTITKYNIDGNILERIRTIANGNNDGKITYAYTKKGQKTQFAMYNPDGTVHNSTKTSYDSDGNELIISYDSAGNVDSRYAVNYDNKGNRIKYNIYNPDGGLTISKIYIYDANENNTEEDWYNDDKTLITKIERVYNKDNKLTEETTNEDLVVTERSTYEYDDKGNMVNQNHFNVYETQDYKYVYQYDSSGNLNGTILTTYENNSPMVFTTIYKDFDKNGNWLRGNFTDGEILYELKVRKIEYY